MKIEFNDFVIAGFLNPNSEVGREIIASKIQYSFIAIISLLVIGAFFFWISSLYNPNQCRQPYDRYRTENKRLLFRWLGIITLIPAIYPAMILFDCFVYPRIVLLDELIQIMGNK